MINTQGVDAEIKVKFYIPSIFFVKEDHDGLCLITRRIVQLVRHQIENAGQIRNWHRISSREKTQRYHRAKDFFFSRGSENFKFLKFNLDII